MIGIFLENGLCCLQSFLVLFVLIEFLVGKERERRRKSRISKSKRDAMMMQIKKKV